MNGPDGMPPAGGPEPLGETGLLFLTGGSAMNRLARAIGSRDLSADYLMGVFDDGGSTGRLREALDCIAIGDIRNRLGAIANRNSASATAVAELFERRLPDNKPRPVLHAMLDELARAPNAPNAGMSREVWGEVSESLWIASATLGGGFDWSGACLGNLALLGRYLHEAKEWDRALQWAHEIHEARGRVLPVSHSSAYLGARLTDHTYVVGQSRMTDERFPLSADISHVTLHRTNRSFAKELHIPATAQALDAIVRARAIVIGWGSIYTSIYPILLVDGVSECIVSSKAPTVLLLNPFRDSETQHLRAMDVVNSFVTHLRRWQPQVSRTIPDVIIATRLPDTSHDALWNPQERAELEAAGMRVIEVTCGGLPSDDELARVVGTLLDARV